MGCDIHLKAQVRDNEGVWHEVDVERECRCAKGPTPGKWIRQQDGQEFECWGCKGRLVITGYNDRNYDTFAILADVRNGSHGEEFITISVAKGLPEDMVPNRRVDDFGYEENDFGFDFGDHSQTWLTLRELQEYPHWEKVINKEGWIGLEEFAVWDANGQGEPKNGYSGGVGGGGVVHVNNDQMRELIAKGQKFRAEWGRGKTVQGATPSYYTVVHWTSTYKEQAHNFYDYFIPALAKLGGPDDVRIVFGFDS